MSQESPETFIGSEKFTTIDGDTKKQTIELKLQTLTQKDGSQINNIIAEVTTTEIETIDLGPPETVLGELGTLRRWSGAQTFLETVGWGTTIIVGGSGVAYNWSSDRWAVAGGAIVAILGLIKLFITQDQAMERNSLNNNVRKFFTEKLRSGVVTTFKRNEGSLVQK